MHSVSLAAIRPREVTGIEISPHRGWSPDELERFRIYSQQGDLFQETPPKLLDAPPFEARLKYCCNERDCTSHTQRIIDWELNALQHSLRHHPEDRLRESIKKNFFHQMFGRDKQPLIFVGNQENPQRRQSFTVLGAYYPKIGDTPGDSVLF
ncbi:hypothetical protein KZX45_17310 [Georgenia sp. EYE_87]|uniref:hypothetical protein n=1 Tax=Georgenia sp. EYE_87 TaxID=2853448 RepID=UPI00200647F4|nr:hypothetical protein [Georgenia sp. EYE_87]MCK6212304.1 hypothetical protein [Georgenia sp. EYE_87]